jgi:hypothetical protein
MQQGVGSEITGNVDIERFGASNQGHSAQFYDTFLSRETYWSDLLIEFGFEIEGN